MVAKMSGGDPKEADVKGKGRRATLICKHAFPHYFLSKEFICGTVDDMLFLGGGIAIAPKVVNVIHAMVDQKKKDMSMSALIASHRQHVNCIRGKRPISEGSSSDSVISFSDADLEGVDLPHNDFLAISLNVGDHQVDKVLVDPGSSIVVASGIADGCMRSDSGPIAVFDSAELAEEVEHYFLSKEFICGTVDNMLFLGGGIAIAPKVVNVIYAMVDQKKKDMSMSVLIASHRQYVNCIRGKRQRGEGSSSGSSINFSDDDLEVIVAASGIADGCMRSDSRPIAMFDSAELAEEVEEGSEMATKKRVGTLKEADLKGKKVFVRVDLNVPLDDNLNITDDTRVRAAVPTIKYLMGHGAKVILASHLVGCPKGATPKYSLKPLVPRLSELLGIEVKMANDCIGEEVQIMVAEIPEGGVPLLENVRFYKEEEKNDPEFAKKLASLADLYVNDAFGTAHRAHASTERVAKYLKPFVAGFLMQKELDYLVGAVSNPKKPFAAIIGGSKVSSKIGVIESLLEKVDMLLLGGGMIFTFYKAQGYSVGLSLVEEDKLDLATSLLGRPSLKGLSRHLVSLMVGWDWTLDIGPDSIKTFGEALDSTKTVIWNGPMGVFEFDKFAVGTETIAKKLADLSGGKGVTTIVGGGDCCSCGESWSCGQDESHLNWWWCKLGTSRGEITPWSSCP
ncbi:hypothetical protein HYC85_011509 [Camellia sinensis]|uniref:Phosphoglycerate kinase n=1 Tax=Camellia sinensis TaxID=4442 RepID=A0A7J7HCI1_CAMSI|nr:hypothetical protein HYC85_011509 [Camellia sinensis]